MLHMFFWVLRSQFMSILDQFCFFDIWLQINDKRISSAFFSHESRSMPGIASDLINSS